MSIVIVGAGPNLGRAIARRFGRERLAVGFIARSTDTLRGLTKEVRAEGLTAAYAAADIRDADALIDETLERGSGTLLSTTGGAAIHPNPLRAGVGISVAGEVAYARMLHDEVRDKGIDVAHTAIGGSIAAGGDHEPEDIAAILWQQHVERTAFQTLVGIES